MNEVKLAEEEAFFQKWLKQRENLGIADATGDNTNQALREARQKLLKKKDMNEKEIKELERQIGELEKRAAMKVSKKHVRKSLNLKIVSALTVKAFIEFLGLDQNDS